MYVNVGSDDRSTVKSGSALKLIANLPSASVVVLPFTISTSGVDTLPLQRYHHHIGKFATRATRYFTEAPSIFAPEYARAYPSVLITSLSLNEPVTGLNPTSNFGRLYSSTENDAL